MQVLALDIGNKRIGVAQGRTDTCIATPVKVLAFNEVLENARPWRLLLEDYEPDFLVFGLPRSLDGAQGKQAAHIRSIAEGIAQRACLPYEFCDERLSSSAAKRIMHEQGLTERDMRGKLDMVAASLFLETWLKTQADKAERE